MNPAGDYTVHFADPDMCVLLLYSARGGRCAVHEPAVRNLVWPRQASSVFEAPRMQATLRRF